MNRQIQAVYEQGVIRPLEPVEFDEGERLEIVLLEKKAKDKCNPAQVLAEIAKLPIESSSGEFSGADHDEVLYPKGEQ
jgi:predicted DNA-binding antitoxin AbrB/MazE fold protein